MPIAQANITRKIAMNTISIYGRLNDPIQRSIEFSFVPRRKWPIHPMAGFTPEPDVWPFTFVVEIPEDAKLQQFGNDRKVEFQFEELNARQVFGMAHCGGFEGFDLISESHGSDTLT